MSVHVHTGGGGGWQHQAAVRVLAAGRDAVHQPLCGHAGGGHQVPHTRG